MFASPAAADKAVADLKAAGYRDDQIGLVAKDASGKAVKTDGAGDTNAGEGMAIGSAGRRRVRPPARPSGWACWPGV